MHAAHRWIVENSQLLDRHEQKQLFNSMIMLFAVADAPCRILRSEVQKNLGKKALRRFTVQKADEDKEQQHPRPLQVAQDAVDAPSSNSLYMPTDLFNFEDRDLYEELHLIHLSSDTAGMGDACHASPESLSYCTTREEEEEQEEEHAGRACMDLGDPRPQATRCDGQLGPAVRSLPEAPVSLPLLEVDTSKVRYFEAMGFTIARDSLAMVFSDESSDDVPSQEEFSPHEDLDARLPLHG